MPIRAYLQFYKDVILYILIFTFICMLLFGITAAFLISTTLGIFIGFLVGLGFFLFNRGFNNIGIVYDIPPILSASLPAMSFLLLAIVMIRRI
jgi:lipopolysaccharide export system permease protein